MSRPPRQLSKTGIYHIMFRGINRQNIFEDSNDYNKMLNILSELKNQYSFELYAYCLMTNHVHLFIKENSTGDIIKIMHKLLTKYVGWFNFKYERSGSLIGNRYKSKPILDDQHYLSLIKYIHNNPLELQNVSDCGDYEYSSYNAYIQGENELVNLDFALNMLSDNHTDAIKKFKAMHSERDSLSFDFPERVRYSDSEAKKIIEKIMNGKDVHELPLFPKQERNSILEVLRHKYKLTASQIERVTGVSRGIVGRI